MDTPESNNLKQLQRRVILETLELNPTAIAAGAEVTPSEVSCVLNDLRPCKRARKKIADHVAARVYEIFGVEPKATG